MNIILKSLMIFLCLSLSLFSQVKNSSNFSVSEERLKRHIEVLGSDLFEGRGTGTKGGELAASYISEVFKSLDLIPIGDNQTYFQSIPLHGVHYQSGSKLYLYSNNDTLELSVGKDYLLSNSGEQTIIPSAKELVFVGYGIIAPEYDHNDYLDKDVTGKIAVMLTGEPESEYDEYFNGDEPTIYSYKDSKHRIAISRGAAGTILIPPLNKDDETTWSKLQIEYSFEDVRLSYNASNSFGIILNPNIARKLFSDKMVQLGSKLTCSSINANNCSLKFEGEFFVRDFRAENVIGMIEGSQSGENQEYIIVSAHYDHLGIGPGIDGDKIYNGVLDNAMGVAALIEVARELKANEEQLKRSVIFLATTGEEKGLLGSTYYVDHPVFPLYKTVANINIDGLAFIDEFKSIIGIGAELSNLENYLLGTANQLNLSVKGIPKEFFSYEAFNKSDQIAFAKAGIPSILVYDSPEYLNVERDTAIKKILNYNQKIYHTPFDDLAIKINYNASVQHTEVLSSFVYNIAISDEEISWKENAPYNYIRLQTIAEKR